MEPLLLFSNLDDLAEVLAKAGPDAKLYLGCDSEAMKLRVPSNKTEKRGGKVRQLYENVWHADYTVVIAIHHREKHVDARGNVTYTGKGSRILGEVVRERLYDQDRRKPRLRLMNEAYKVADAFIRLKPLIEDHELEIHLDINPKVEFNSSIVVKEAAAYVRGMTQIEPMVKNRAFAASFAADRFKEIANVARVKKGVVKAS
jgi:predicted RNase H-related nuclease YkuK (DUF458 family)